jgi:hypothetical protein
MHSAFLAGVSVSLALFVADQMNLLHWRIYSLIAYVWPTSLLLLPFADAPWNQKLIPLAIASALNGVLYWLLWRVVIFVRRLRST